MGQQEAEALGGGEVERCGGGQPLRSETPLEVAFSLSGSQAIPRVGINSVLP
jgi:hypothetical protein